MADQTYHRHETRHFPEGFLWGVATAAYQFEGGNDRSDWARWERVPGRIQDGSTVGLGADHWHRWAEDLDLCREMGNNAHRLSVEWARLEPEEGKWDGEAFLHYAEVLRGLKERGMKVMLTLWHFTLPGWFADIGGWESPRAIDLYLRFVREVARRLGDHVDFWCTMNEPNVYASQGYLSGGWPPGIKSVIRSQLVSLKLAKAHRRAYRALHEELDRGGLRAQVGLAQNAISIEAYDQHSLLDWLGVQIIDFWWNHLYHALTHGCHDFIGLNYYFHFRLKKFTWPPTSFFVEVRRERRDTSDVGWELNPAGIFRVLRDYERYKLPIYITENGLPSQNDDRRKRLIVATLKEAYHAIHSGVDLRGYFFWSLTDVFEWEKGYVAKFGLCEIEPGTLNRKPRGSYSVYREICRANGLPHEMLRYVGHAVDQPYTPLATGLHAPHQHED